MLHSDKSYIFPADVKTGDEGKGQLYASIGKELDEHDVIGKVGGASAFALRLFALSRFFLIVGSIIVLILMAITGLVGEFFLAGANNKAIKMEGKNKRIITTDKVREYQIRDSNGYWYVVDENTYNLK